LEVGQTVSALDVELDRDLTTDSKLPVREVGASPGPRIPAAHEPGLPGGRQLQLGNLSGAADPLVEPTTEDPIDQHAVAVDRVDPQLPAGMADPDPGPVDAFSW